MNIWEKEHPRHEQWLKATWLYKGWIRKFCQTPLDKKVSQRENTAFFRVRWIELGI